MPENFDEMLNPQVRTVKIGTRTMREIKIYPLSVGDEVRFLKTVGEAIQQFQDPEIKDAEAVAIGFIARLVEENLPKLIKMVADDVTIDDMSNKQAAEIAEIIIDENFESISKNVRSLSDKIKKVFRLGRPLQSSANSIPDTDLSTFSEEVSKTEESPKES